MRGGSRPGAGRKPGSANRKTREIAERALADGITPLEVMLEAMRKTYEGEDGKQRNAVAAFPFAVQAGPFIHARMQAIGALVQVPSMQGSPAEQGRAVLEALSRGEVSPDQASTIMQAISAQARIVEVDELEKRVAALEQGQKADR